MAKAAAKHDDNVVELKRNSPSEDAVVAVNLGKISKAKSEFETANANYRNVLKHVEAKGIHLAAAKKALAIKKSGKVEETIEDLKALFEYLMVLGCGVEKKQLELFRVEDPDRDGVAKARERGRKAGLLAEDIGNPYAPDSELGQAFMQGVHEGTKERNLVLSMEPAGEELIKGGADEDEGDPDVFDDEDEE